MTVYTVSTKIESNVPAELLSYDLSIYRTSKNKTKTYLLSGISKQSLLGKVRFNLAFQIVTR